MNIGIWGMEPIGEVAGDCGPTPGGSTGILGMAGMAGVPGADCGPMPGGEALGGIGIPGGAETCAVSVVGGKCMKL